MASGEVAPSARATARCAETLGALRDSGFSGYLSLEPHLALARQFGGFSGAAGFRRAAAALKSLLAALAIPWS